MLAPKNSLISHVEGEAGNPWILPYNPEEINILPGMTATVTGKQASGSDAASRIVIPAIAVQVDERGREVGLPRADQASGDRGVGEEDLLIPFTPLIKDSLSRGESSFIQQWNPPVIHVLNRSN